MSVRETKINQVCFTCHGDKLIPLGKGDYLECPDCAGTGRLLMIEQLITPTAHSIVVPRRIG